MLWILLLICATNSIFIDVSTHEKLDLEWSNYKYQSKLEFSKEEDERRRDIFLKNIKIINEHNQKESSYKLGITSFTHMTTEEFSQFVKKSSPKRPILKRQSENLDITFNGIKNIDWREKGAVTEVRRMGLCNSDWCFSATGSLESQYFIKNKKLLKLSEQDLLDCSGSYGNAECRGGLMEFAFDYIKDHGIHTESDYPYLNYSKACRHNDSESLLKIKKYFLNEDANETLLSLLISNVGPISVAYETDSESFKLYKSGIYESPKCTSDNPNGYMLAVGLGGVGSKDTFYIVRNNFGKRWGMEGYFFARRNKGNMCGISSYITYPILN